MERSSLTEFLFEIGTCNLSHSGRPLMDHLIGTYDLLKQWECDKTTRIAGGLHSVYGTNIFTVATLSIEKRPIVSEKFGADVERLAWLFSILNRPKAIEYGFGVDRRNDEEVVISIPDLQALRLIEASNILEQNGSLNKWPNIMKALKQQVCK